MAHHNNRKALVILISGVGLIATGSGLAWLSEQDFFHKDVFPHQSAAKPATPVPTASASVTPNPEKSTAAQQKAPEKPATTKHTVKSGDTLSSVADQYGVSLQAIADANNLREPYTLNIGQELTIPDA